jgi:hypothetical protein
MRRGKLYVHTERLKDNRIRNFVTRYNPQEHDDFSGCGKPGEISWRCSSFLSAKDYGKKFRLSRLKGFAGYWAFFRK